MALFIRDYHIRHYGCCDLQAHWIHEHQRSPAKME